MLFKSRLHPIWRGSARPPSAQESKGLSPVRVISGFKRRARRCLLWIEDRAGSIIAVIVAVWLTALGLLLLSSWALAVSIAIPLAAILTILAATASAATAAFKWLRRHREDRTVPPLPGTGSKPVARGPRPGGTTGEQAGHDGQGDGTEESVPGDRR
jgi:hypothetical protein